MKTTTKKSNSPPLLTATTAEGMENELISMAYELVAQRIQDGTATSAETVHFLKMGSTKERYERERLKKELELMQAKTEALQSAKRVEELYNKAIEAMRDYAGMQTYDE